MGLPQALGTCDCRQSSTDMDVHDLSTLITFLLMPLMARWQARRLAAEAVRVAGNKMARAAIGSGAALVGAARHVLPHRKVLTQDTRTAHDSHCMELRRNKHLSVALNVCPLCAGVCGASQRLQRCSLKGKRGDFAPRAALAAKQVTEECEPRRQSVGFEAGLRGGGRPSF